MTFDECVRLTYLDWESWLILFVSLAISLGLWKIGKTVLAIVIGCFGLLFAGSWAYSFYVLTCVELIGL
ncbi:hypothetical protein [Actibacterium mucosum]|nr:hypothetical protein [Actibacterium mucosum]